MAPSTEALIMIGSIEKKLLIYLGIILLVLITLGILVYQGLQAMNVAANQVNNTLTIQNKIDSLFSHVKSAELLVRGYILSGDQQYLNLYSIAKKESEADLRELQALTADNPNQHRRLIRLRDLTLSAFATFDRAIEARRTQEAARAMHLIEIEPAIKIKNDINRLVGEMLQEELGSYRERMQNQASKAKVAAAVTVAGVLIAAALLVLTGVLMHREIARQVKSEQELRERQQELRLALGAGNAGLWSWNIDNNRLSWSDEYYALLGLKPGMGQPSYHLWAGCLHVDDRERVERELETAIKNKRDFNTEYRIIRPDGEIRWVLVRSQLEIDQNGKPTAMSGVAIDVTEHKRAEEALYESEERFRQIAENVEAVFWIMDARSGQTVFISSGIERLWGVSAQNLLDHRDNWSDHIHPEDREKARKLFLEQAASGGFDHEYRLITPDGRHRWVKDSAFPVKDRMGNVTRIAGFAVDITSRKQIEEERERLLALEKEARLAAEMSEQRFRLITEAIPNVAWTAAPDGQCEFFNQHWHEYTGLTVEESIGFGWQSAVYPDDLPKWRRKWQLTFETGEAYEVEYRIRRASDGAYRWFLARALPMRDEKNRIIRWIGTSTDIDDQKKSEEIRAVLLAREQEARAQAEVASRMKDEFLAVVSHELRSPLNAMLGWARVLRSEGVDRQTHDHAIEVIEQSAEMQSRLIEDLLDSARIVSGKLRIESRPVNLVPAINAALDTVRPAAENKGVKILTDLNPDAGIVTGDAERLQQVVWNLLSNAVKFTPSGGTVQVRLSREDPYISIMVKDTGKGIRPEDLSIIFHRFQQADSSSTRRAGGLGLGLSLVQNLVELHGGTITVESAGEGRGATFTVKLPLRAISTPVTSTGSMRALSFPPVLEGLNILTVDDEAEARDLIATLLRKYGAKVTPVSSSTEALNALTQDGSEIKFDLLVSDIGMPSENGYTLIRRVRQLPTPIRNVPAVALTAFGRAEDRISALEAGFQMHVPKPVEPAELMMVIATLTGRSTKIWEE